MSLNNILIIELFNIRSRIDFIDPFSSLCSKKIIFDGCRLHLQMGGRFYLVSQ